VLAVVPATLTLSLVAEAEQPCTPGNMAGPPGKARAALDALK
jgi:hypothetical protein